MLPPYLRPGDAVGVIATARSLDDFQREVVRQTLEASSFCAVYGHTFSAKPDRIFAASDAERLSDLEAMLLDPQIKAIYCARGGYGSARLADELDLTLLRSHPKWLVGFSDITMLHLCWNRAGVASLHAPVLLSMSGEDLRLVENVLQGKEPPFHAAPANDSNRIGKAAGSLVGGNLSLIVSSLGTRDEPETEGRILVLEEVDEYEYRIDRMIVQLKRAGLLRDLAGLAVGAFSRVPDNDPAFGSDYREIIREHTASEDYPVAFGLPFGHEPPNTPLMLNGLLYSLTVTDSGAQLRPQSSDESP